MKIKQKKRRPLTAPDQSKHPYLKYESNPIWRRIDKGISDLVQNQDLVEKAARPYIVGYLCEAILGPRKDMK